MPSIDPTNLFGFLVHDTARLLSRAYERLPMDIKLTRMQARVLAYISVNEGAKQADIARLMDVQKIRITKLVDDLEALQLIERKADPDDRRVRRLYMSEGAHPVLDKIWQKLSDVSDIALAPLSEAQQKALVQNLVKVRDCLLENGK